MEYYYDRENDFYIIKLNGNFNPKEYSDTIKKIINDPVNNPKTKRTDFTVCYTTFTDDSKYVIVDFQKRPAEEIKALIGNNKVK